MFGKINCRYRDSTQKDRRRTRSVTPRLLCFEARQVRELLRIGHNVHRTNERVPYIENQHRVRLAVKVAYDPRTAIDPGGPESQILRKHVCDTVHQAPCHLFRTMDQVWYRDRLPAAVAVKRDLAREHLDQAFHIAVTARCDEVIEENHVFSSRRLEPPTHGSDVLPRPVEDLAAIRFGLTEREPDFRVLEIEHLVQKKHGALNRRKPFEKDEQGHRKGLIQAQNSEGVVFLIGHHRLREPLTDVFHALRPSRLQLVDAQPADDRDQQRSRISDLGLRLLPADERLLNHVLGVSDAAEHPVRD